MELEHWGCGWEFSGILGYSRPRIKRKGRRRRRKNRRGRKKWRRKMTLMTTTWDLEDEMNQERKFQNDSKRSPQGCSFMAGLGSHHLTQEKDSRRDVSTRNTGRLERCV